MTDRIIKELAEAQEVLSTFLQDADNHKKIQEAATIIAKSINDGGKVFLVVMAVPTVMPCTLRRN